MQRAAHLGIIIWLLSFLSGAQSQEPFPIHGEHSELILGFGKVRSIQLAPDGKSLATRSTVGTFLWDVTTGSLRSYVPPFIPRTFPEDLVLEPSRVLAFSPDNRKLLVVSELKDNGAAVVDVNTGRIILQFPAQGTIRSNRASTLFFLHVFLPRWLENPDRQLSV